MQFLKSLVFPGGFVPHGCSYYLWVPSLFGPHVISDTLIARSYLSIPITLALHWLTLNRPPQRRIVFDGAEKSL